MLESDDDGKAFERAREAEGTRAMRRGMSSSSSGQREKERDGEIKSSAKGIKEELMKAV